MFFYQAQALRREKNPIAISEPKQGLLEFGQNVLCVQNHLCVLGCHDSTDVDPHTSFHSLLWSLKPNPTGIICTWRAICCIICLRSSYIISFYILVALKPYLLLTLLLAASAQFQMKVMNRYWHFNSLQGALCVPLMTLSSVNACHRWSAPKQFGHWSCLSSSSTRAWQHRFNN